MNWVTVIVQVVTSVFCLDCSLALSSGCLYKSLMKYNITLLWAFKCSAFQTDCLQIFFLNKAPLMKN